MPLVLPVAVAVPLLVGLFAAPLLAQSPPDEPETRAEALRREREQKQQEVEPYEKNAVERGMILAERRILPLLNRDGIYARLGSLTTASGSITRTRSSSELDRTPIAAIRWPSICKAVPLAATSMWR